MANLKNYIKRLEEALHWKDGNLLADLLSFKRQHVTLKQLKSPGVIEKCHNCFETSFSEVVIYHLRAAVAVGDGQFDEAYAAQTSVVQTFIKYFQSMKDENWPLQVLYAMSLDLRQFALVADKQLRARGEGKLNETVEKSAEHLMGCFRVCVTDTRASLDVSKKWGMLAIVNQLFKIYFKINKLQLCKPLVRAIDQLSNNIKNNFKVSHMVTYRYYVGKKAMFDSNYKLANEYLSYAFERCHHDSKNNKRHILMYLIPVKMQLGLMPSKIVLRKYNLNEFTDIATAVSSGNLKLLNDALQYHEEFFIQAGVYLLLEKLKIITYRNLFKKTYLLLNSNKLPIEAFRVVLHSMGETDVDSDEVECLIANLIYSGYVKGYISHQFQKLVVSKQNPFPALSTFLEG